MTLKFTSRRLTFALCAALLWACSSNDSNGSDAGGAPQNSGGSKAGSAAVGGSSGSGGKAAQDPDQANGNRGSVGEDEPDDEPAKGGKSGNPEQPPPEQGEGGGEGDGEPEPEPPSEGFLRGKAFVEHNECIMCHTENFAGFTVFPNITPDEETGIGSWTDEEIIAAIRDGVEPDGSKLCDTMMRYPLSDEEAADVVEFLRGIPAVSNRLTSDCP